MLTRNGRSVFLLYMTHGLAWRDLELSERIGEGHSGSVFRARAMKGFGSITVGTDLAVKRYKAWVLEESGQIERIFREVEIGRTLRHPNLIDVVGAVLDPDGRPALVMKFYEGETLEHFLAKSWAAGDIPNVNRALMMLRGIASGIVALHDKGIIHRDIKPANIMLTVLGPVIGDFGVVRSSEFASQTTTGAFLGTIRYAAPEYLFGDDYTASIDVYSFGAVAYELLIGRQWYARYKHWARLVAAKMTTQVPLGNGDLDRIARRSNLRLARFLRFALDNSATYLERRKLRLASFVDAIDRTIWDGPLEIRDGEFLRHQGVFKDEGRTPENAAAMVRSSFGPGQYAILKRVLRQSIWTRLIPINMITQSFTHELLRCGIATKRKGGHLVLAESVAEAVFLDLI